MSGVSGRGNANGRRNIPLSKRLRLSYPHLTTRRKSAVGPSSEVEFRTDATSYDSSSESESESDSELGETSLVVSTSNISGASSVSGKAPLSVTLTDLSFLDCPICCGSLLPPVYQCKNGHVACARCCTQMANKCPSCRSSVGSIRNRVLEKFIESVAVKCRNRLYGCMEVFYQELDKLNHEKICCYSPCTCPFDSCTYIGMPKPLYIHFGGAHSPSTFSFGTAKLFSFGENQTRIFLQDAFKCTLFILERKVMSPAGFVSVTCVGLGWPSMAFTYCLKAVIDRKTSVKIKGDVVFVKKWTGGSNLGKCMFLPSSMVDKRGMLTLELVVRRG